MVEDTTHQERITPYIDFVFVAHGWQINGEARKVYAFLVA